MQRRTALNALCAGLTGGAVVGLAGCGFALRQAPVMPFQSVVLVGFAPRSSLERTIRTQLAQVTQIEDIPSRAEVVLQALNDARERVVVATTAAGQVRELQLRVRLTWRASNPKGRVLIEPGELVLTRDMSYIESAALAKEQEAETLYAAMDEDIALQLMRRLAKLKMNPAA
jgi:LPS-assembly lipoprotein